MKQIVILLVAAGLVLFAIYMMYMGMTQPTSVPDAAIEAESPEQPQSPQLEDASWVWVETIASNSDVFRPVQTEAFTLAFDGTQVAISTDCNSGSGTYSANDGQLSFGPLASTKMYCEGSQESDFFLMLRDVAGYQFSDNGQLILDLKFDSGSIVLRPL